MIIVLIIMIVSLLILNGIQYKEKMMLSKDLIYITNKIEKIIKNKTREKLMVFTDTHELKALLEEINNLLNYNESIVINHAKTEIAMKKMLSNVSHDLKTPLTVILGSLEVLMLEEDMDSEEQKKLLHKVHSRADELLKLINKFFTLAKLEAGDTLFEQSPINMNEVCRKNILAFYDSLNHKGMDVSIDIPKQNIYILGNEEALNRILNNLLSNALKYGSDGNIIGIRLKADDTSVYVEVWDKGKGISGKHIDHIFERMYTLEESRNKFFEGSGLGLTITKRLIETLGGEISVFSKPYYKTTFSFQLPKHNIKERAYGQHTENKRAEIELSEK